MKRREVERRREAEVNICETKKLNKYRKAKREKIKKREIKSRIKDLVEVNTKNRRKDFFQEEQEKTKDERE